MMRCVSGSSFSWTRPMAEAEASVLLSRRPALCDWFDDMAAVYGLKARFSLLSRSLAR